ncbi:RNA polymerase sigma factor [Marinifilum fragile]|uniref:RNA polymerase sigma factor n=1 Tax=Marinifilum fragile TaxID=570161 RepID=UPI0006CFCADA|nr:sigma-70 family RNA polymerase sigma factor [Marinifilum fragile]
MITDQSILEHIRRGDKEGLDFLFRRYYKPLVLYANAFVNDIHKAEDVVQELFIKFWNDKLFDRLYNNTLSTYLFALVKNASLNHINKKDILSDTAEFSHLEIAEEEARRIAEEGIQKVKQAIEELPEKTRKVVECIMIQNMKYKEAAEELEVSVNTVKTLLRNGISKLKEDLKDHKDLFHLFFL